MRSSAGEHWIALDHVRAVAAFLVFTFHFLHAETGGPVALGQPPILFPLALADQGQTGVALFMTLSGYLFAKIVADQDLHFATFLWNRAVRLLPLMVLVLLAMVITRTHTHGPAAGWIELQSIYYGLLDPFRPLQHGLWSVVVEAHFYLILPLLVALRRWWRWAPLALVAGAFAMRLGLALANHDIERIAYWTILGRIDQFVLGMSAFYHRGAIAGRTRTAGAIFLFFAAFYWWFDGTVGHPGSSGKMIWIAMPTIEGLTYASLIAWYDARPSTASTGLSIWVGRAGSWSYSIYLLHFYLVFRMAAWIETHIMSLANIYVACLWSLLCFAAMIPIGWASFRFIEQPFLRFRQRYVRAPAGTATVPAGAVATKAGCASM